MKQNKKMGLKTNLKEFNAVLDIGKSFKVYHNLPLTVGLSIQDALCSWEVRTNKFTAESFCEYVQSKDYNNICLTKRQYDKKK